MIASNYRKFPEAMALQLVLVFGRCTWHTARPTTRLGRAVRAARAVLVKATPQLVRWVKKATPAWFKQAKRAARELAKQVRAACEVFVWDAQEQTSSTPYWEQRVIDDYERKTGLDYRTRKPKRSIAIKAAKPTRCDLEWCEDSNWDGVSCKAAFCGLKGPKGGYH